MGLVFFYPFSYSMSFDWNINPFIFKVIIAKYVVIAILLFSDCFCSSFFVPFFFFSSLPL